jgi:hypothetical protein
MMSKVSEKIQIINPDAIQTMIIAENTLPEVLAWGVREGVNIPYVKLRNRNAYRVLTSPVHVTITFGGKHHQFVFKKGHVWDLASVPGITKFMMDNDDPRTLLASLIHDYFFGTHAIGRRV